jgi:hypothetical protein
MAKDSISLVPLTSSGAFNKWRYCVGRGGAALASGVPVQQSFYAAFSRGAKCGKMHKSDLVESGFFYLAKGLSARVVPISDRSRYSYWLAFGVTPNQQIMLEEHYNTVLPTWTEPSRGEYISIQPPINDL